MRTSIDVPDALMRRARKLARQRGVSLKQLFIDGLRIMIEHDAGGPPHQMKDHSFGQGGLVEGLSWSDTDRMDELIYGERD